MILHGLLRLKLKMHMVFENRLHISSHSVLWGELVLNDTFFTFGNQLLGNHRSVRGRSIHCTKSLFARFKFFDICSSSLKGTTYSIGLSLKIFQQREFQLLSLDIF